MTDRRTISSGGRWEAVYGYSRAVVVGNACYVAGTSDAGPDGTARHPGAYFRDIRPASAMIVMVGLVDPSLLVEIEADAVRAWAARRQPRAPAA